MGRQRDEAGKTRMIQKQPQPTQQLNPTQPQPKTEAPNEPKRRRTQANPNSVSKKQKRKERKKTPVPESRTRSQRSNSSSREKRSQVLKTEKEKNKDLFPSLHCLPLASVCDYTPNVQSQKSKQDDGRGCEPEPHIHPSVRPGSGAPLRKEEYRTRKWGGKGKWAFLGRVSSHRKWERVGWWFKPGLVSWLGVWYCTGFGWVRSGGVGWFYDWLTGAGGR